MRWCCLIAALLLCAGDLSATGQNSSLRAEISVAQTTVRNSPQRPKPADAAAWPHEFSVSTTIRNVSAGEQTIQVTACGFAYQWQTDNPEVYVDGGACSKNAIDTIRLRPGETYTRSIPVFIEIHSDFADAERKAVTFRLGFGDSFWNEKLRAERQAIWSNPVRVFVTQ